MREASGQERATFFWSAKGTRTRALKRPASVVDLYVPLVEIQLVVLAVVDAGGERVSRVAGHVIRQHEDDV